MCVGHMTTTDCANKLKDSRSVGGATVDKPIQTKRIKPHENKIVLVIYETLIWIDLKR